MDPTPNLTRDPEFERLLVQLYAGTCSDADRARVERLLAESPDERRVVETLRGASADEPKAAEIAAAFDGLLARVREHDRTHQRHTVRDGASRGMRRDPVGHRIDARASWTLGQWAYGAVATVVLIVAGFLFQLPSREAAPTEFRTVVTRAGERATIRLADGSSVVLGARSAIRYSAEFGTVDRDVHLEGEAYFEVTRHTTRPFIVRTRNATTRVLGTAFSVRAYPGDTATRVIVADGKVALQPPSVTTSLGTILVRGDRAEIVDNGGITTWSDVPVKDHLEWTQGKLVYRNIPLREVVPELERWYGLEFVIRDSAVAESKITLALDVESVDQAIAAFSRVSGLRATRQKNTVIISQERR